MKGNILGRLSTIASSTLIKLSFIFIISSSFSYGQNSIIDQVRFKTFSGWGIKDVMKEVPKLKKNINLKAFKKKADVVVAMIDSGIQYNHPFIPKDQLFMPKSHPMLARKHWNKKISPSFYGIDFSSKKVTFAPNDVIGHGTHVTGIVKQVFKDAKFLVLKYYDPKGDNTDSSIQALRFAVMCPEVDIINYSGGGPGASLEEKNLILEAKKKGKILVAAAGNERSNIDYMAYSYFPASYNLENIVSVSAHDINGDLASASSWGKNTVHISAPGKSIRSAFLNGQAYPMTGTSQATAFVSGAMGFIKSRFPKLNMLQIKKIILDSAQISQKFKDKTLTQGALRLKAAVKKAINLSVPKIKLKRIAQKEAIISKKIKRSVAKDN